MADRLGDARALVIGASSGIGRAIATTYADEGAAVVVAARSTDTLAELAVATDGIIGSVPCDVRETSSVDAAVSDAADMLDGLDVVVNSAGVIVRADVIATDDDDLEWVIDVNFAGMVRVARAAMPELIASGGTLILVSSQLGEVGVENASVYCGTKGGINNLARQLAVEYADDGVRVNALAPGVVKTPMNAAPRAANDRWEVERRKRIPLDRLATPTDIAGPAVFLASEEASYITGQVLTVDGGYTAQ